MEEFDEMEIINPVKNKKASPNILLQKLQEKMKNYLSKKKKEGDVENEDFINYSKKCQSTANRQPVILSNFEYKRLKS